MTTWNYAKIDQDLKEQSAAQCHAAEDFNSHAPEHPDALQNRVAAKFIVQASVSIERFLEIYRI